MGKLLIARAVLAVSGGITGVANSAAIAVGPVWILSIPIFVEKGFVPFLIAIAFALFAVEILTYFFGFSDNVPKNSNYS